jgi:hypothetical protein
VFAVGENQFLEENLILKTYNKMAGGVESSKNRKKNEQKQKNRSTVDHCIVTSARNDVQKS